MSLSTKFTIDLNEPFPKLRYAPSIEAIIYWQARPSKLLEPATLKHELGQRLSEYPDQKLQEHIEVSASIEADGSSAVGQRREPNGIILEDNRHHVVQFTQQGVVFSRLRPYEQWDSFMQEALRLWDVFVELAEPETVQQLGVRYINQILLARGETPETYLKNQKTMPTGPDLNQASFFYQDTYKIPDHPTYQINWVRTIQTQMSGEQFLIVDINVFAAPVISMEREALVQKLNEMRWIKNKIFFSGITETALEKFRG